MRLKNIIMLAASVLCTLPTMAQKPFKLQGTVTANHQKYYVYLADENFQMPEKPTDSIIVKKGTFKYQLKLNEPRPINLNDPTQDYSMDFMAVPGETCKLTVTPEEYTHDGTAFYQQYGQADNAYTQMVRDIQTKYTEAIGKLKAAPNDSARQAMTPALQQELEALVQNAQNQIDAYPKEHANEEGAIVYFAVVNDPTTALASASESVKNGRFGRYLTDLKVKQEKRREAQAKAEAEAKAALDKSGEGQMFVDFEAEYDGKVQHLSDYVGKGKYVLVDFWASWCGPCKAEIPNLIKCWEAHHDDKFEVLGVATWDKPDATLKAIEQLGIPYPQIMNAQKAGSDAYGIQGIPQIILFGPDGTILKRDLRGEAIEATVSEYLNK